MSGASGLRKHGHTTDGDGGTIAMGGSSNIVSSTGDHVYLEPDSGYVVMIDTGDGLVYPTRSSDPTGAENSHTYWNSVTKQLREFRKNSNPSTGQWYDLTSQGWITTAYPQNFDQNGTYSTAVTLPANGGSLACPMVLVGPMKAKGFDFWGTDTSLVREWEIGLYFDNGHSATADIQYDSNEFAGGGTVSAAGLRSLTFSTPPVLPAGIVWAVIRNTSASNTLGVGTVAATGSFTTTNSHQTKTLGSFLGGSNLDLVTGWSKATGIPGVVLRGEVLGQSSAY